MSELEAMIILELAKRQLSVIRVADAMTYHRNTIYYHIRKIHRDTGLDPLDFFDMQKLYSIAQEVLTRA